jgi:hypothetical protein
MSNLFEVIVKNASSGWNAYVGRHVADTAEEAIETAVKNVAYYTTSEFRVFTRDLGEVTEKSADEVAEDDKGTGEVPEATPEPEADPAPVTETSIEEDLATTIVDDLEKLPGDVLARLKAKLGIGGSALQS